MFDKQDEEDDFNGVEQGARDIITGVSQVIAETLMYKKCMMVFLNGSDEEVHVNKFGFNPDYCEHLVVWAFSKPSPTIHNHWREMEDNELRYTHLFIFTSQQAASLKSSELNTMLLQEADSIVARHPCMRCIDSTMIKDCFLYELFMQCNFHGVTRFDWAAHASNYWICDGIIKKDITREILNTLHQEICWEHHDPSMLGSLFEKLNEDTEAPFMVLKGHTDNPPQLHIQYKNRPYRWICIASKNWIVHEDIQSVLQKATSLVIALKESNSPQGLPNGFFKQCSKLGVLILSWCAFNFASPPFLNCHVLRFLGLHHCTHDKTSENQEKNNIKWECLRTLLVLDIRYTDWDEILSEQKLGLMNDLMELNIEGAGGSCQYTSRLQIRLPQLRRLRIIKPKNQYQEETTSTHSSNSFLGKTELEILDFSGNKGMSNIPISLSTLRSLMVLILDGCDGLENVVVPGDGLPSSLMSFSFDGYGPMDHWTSSFKLPPESCRPKSSSRGERDIKTSKISLQGCKQLENLFVRGLPNLVEIDLSGSAIKLLDLDSMLVDVPQLKRIFLLGCEHLRAIKWGPYIELTLSKLELVCIDTRPGRTEHGFTRPPLPQHKLFSLQLHAVLADARLIRSLSPLLQKYCYSSKGVYFNVILSLYNGGAAHVTEPSNLQHRRVQASLYVDVFTEIGNAGFPMLEFPKPPAEQLDCHVEIGDGSRCLESEVQDSRYPYNNLGYLMRCFAESVHVHDTSARTCTPASEWYSLKWFRVERCPSLDTVFPPGSDCESHMETIWASDLLKARCIWSKGDTSYFKHLQHLHLRSCPRLRFAMPVWVGSSPDLKTLHIIHCGDLRHIFELDGRHPEKEAENNLSFLNLTTIHLHDLPKLEQITYGLEMIAPALETIKIRGCFHLCRLPAMGSREPGTVKPAVEMEKDVWDALEWSGVDAGHHPGLFQPLVHSHHYRMRRLLRGTVLR
ncbi:unnamed protein product [Urochloa decumbens]|uniref:Disease resistance protein At4g27190-like leucine-rich repeats domain-containing protein n=1 Tax=Urochloa decumbens TaxID=240449 RepID=A0ABC9F0J8_9POAL